MSGQFHDLGRIDELGGLLAEYEILGHVQAAARLALEAESFPRSPRTWPGRLTFPFDAFEAYSGNPSAEGSKENE